MKSITPFVLGALFCCSLLACKKSNTSSVSVTGKWGLHEQQTFSGNSTNGASQPKTSDTVYTSAPVVLEFKQNGIYTQTNYNGSQISIADSGTYTVNNRSIYRISSGVNSVQDTLNCSGNTITLTQVLVFEKSTERIVWTYNRQ